MQTRTLLAGLVAGTLAAGANAALINAGGNVITTSGTVIDTGVGSAGIGGVSDGVVAGPPNGDVFTDAPGGFPSDYIAVAGAPVFVLDLGSDVMLDAAAVFNRPGTGNGNEIRSIQFRIATDAQVASADGSGHDFAATNVFDSGAITVADVGNGQQDLGFFGIFTGRYVEVTILDNGFGIGAAVGGDRVGFEDIQFNQVPEPGSLALLGLGGLAMLRRRRA